MRASSLLAKPSLHASRRQRWRRLWEAAFAQRGVLILETVIVVMIFAVVGTAVMAGLGTAHRSAAGTERHAIAENIARNQMELMFQQTYQPPPYSYPTVSVPANYAVTCQAQTYVAGDPNIEKVVVTVSFGGAPVVVVETLRAK